MPRAIQFIGMKALAIFLNTLPRPFVYNVRPMRRRLFLAALLWGAIAYAEGPFSVRFDIPSALREWEEGSMTVRVTAPAGEKPVLLARVVPPSEDAFRFQAGTVSGRNAEGGMLLWEFQFTVKCLKAGSHAVKPFTLQYYEEPPTDPEAAPKDQAAPCPPLQVKGRWPWKRMGFWYLVGSLLVAAMAGGGLFFYLKRRKGRKP